MPFDSPGKAAKRTTTRVEVPTLEQASPAYAASIEKRRELLRRKRDVEIELAELAETISKPSAILTAENEARIAVLLGDENDADLADLAELRSRYAELQAMLPSITKALGRIDDRIAHGRMEASNTICAAVKNEHARRAKRVCETLLAAHEAHLTYAELTEELTDKDVAWSVLRPAHPALLGDPRDAHSRLAGYLRESAESGFIAPEQIPESLRP